jgi:RHS repeat-associated protein
MKRFSLTKRPTRASSLVALALGAAHTWGNTPPCVVNNPCPDQFDPPSYVITPQATGNPGSCGATGVPVNPATGCTSCGQGAAPSISTLPTYWVSEPFANLRVESVPLRYQPSHGWPLEFILSYRQRGAAREDATVFGFSTGWSSSFRAYLVDLSGSAGVYRVHRGDAGYIDYVPAVAQYLEGSIATPITGGYQIEYRDGSKETFTNSFVNSGGTTLYFLSTRADPAGVAFVFNYSVVGTIFELTSVTDTDGRSTDIYYDSSTFPNQITKVVDPFSRTNIITYNASGYLTNLTDAGGLSSSFQYDAGLWQSYVPALTNMTTPYGSTAFTLGGVDSGSLYISSGSNSVNRFVQTTLPNTGVDLYEYRLDCSAFLSATNSPVPSTSPLANTLDNVDHQNRNSFHWSPLQTQALSTNNPLYLSTSDYGLGRLRHFLIDPASADASYTYSLERAPSPDGVTTGQFTWYDHDGKTNGDNYIGTNDMSSFVALVLPDSTTRYMHTSRNPHKNLSQEISTYTKTDGSVGERTNTYYYAANNIDLIQQVGPNSEQVISNYFSAGNDYHQPDSTYDALNQQTSYLYNGNREVTQISRPTGLTTTNIYFSSGAYANWLSTTIELEIYRTNSYTYANGLVNSHTDERGLTTTSYWDNLLRLTGVSYPDGTTISNQYTASDLTGTKDRDGNWSWSLYNSVRQKIADTNADGAVTRFGYCTCGMLEQITNALGQVTSFNYDYQANRTYVYFPDATLTNWYNALGQGTVSSIGWGYETNLYNNQGLLSGVSTAYGSKLAVTFDDEDRPVYTIDANGVTVTNTYDVLGRVLTRGYPDGGAESFGYSARGMIAATNQVGFVTDFGLDQAGRRNFETNANSERLQYYYTPAGDLTNLVDGGGHSVTGAFDPYGRLTNKLDQTGTQILSYQYDPAGRLTNRWSAAKGNTAYLCDPAGNVTNIVYPVSHRVVFQYDALNRLTEMVDGVGTNTYTYTTGGQLATEGGVFANDILTNTYLNHLRVALSLAQPSGSWTNGFGYDAAGRLTNVTSQAGSFGYTLGGPSPTSLMPRKITLPNSSMITNYYDAVARITGTLLVAGNGSTLDSAIYGYNVAGQRTAFTNAAGTYVQYTYDNIGQLKTATSSMSSENRGYSIDPCWNINWVTNNGRAYNLLVDTKNELTNAYSATYTYDANGNLTSGTNNHDIYSYDDENRLINWFYFQTAGQTNNGDLRSDFIYDGLGRLREREEWTWTGGLSPVSGIPYSGSARWQLTSATEYIYDGKRVVQERDSASNPVVAYTRGPDLGSTFEGVGGIGGLLARSDGYSGGSFTNHSYYHADGNGNITYLENGSQGLAASYRYDPFGNVLASSGDLAAANTYRFSSKECHTNSGMYCYLHRIYNLSVQRWLSRDPTSDPAFGLLRNAKPLDEHESINLYLFVFNSPVNLFDAFGDTVARADYQSLWPNSATELGLYQFAANNSLNNTDRSDNLSLLRNCSRSQCNRGCSSQQSSCLLGCFLCALVPPPGDAVCVISCMSACNTYALCCHLRCGFCNRP